MKKLYVAGGCFWCIGDYFLMQDGVEEVNCGYSGGDERNATYYDVKAQKTGHRETIEIIYDENVISLEKLVDHYFIYVDVLDEDGQMIDRGHSYSLALYYQNEEEKKAFEIKKAKVEEEIAELKAVLERTQNQSDISDADIDALKSGKEKLMNDSQALFTQMYQNMQNMGGQYGSGSGNSDDVVDGDYREV